MSQFQSLNPPLTTPDIPGVVEPYFGLGTGIWDLYRSFKNNSRYFPYLSFLKNIEKFRSQISESFRVENEISDRKLDSVMRMDFRVKKFEAKNKFWVENEIFSRKWNFISKKDLTLRFLKRILWNIYDKLDANFCKNLKSDKSSFSNNCENDKKCTIVP